MLKLYTNKSFLVEEYRSRVFPLLFDLCFIKNKHLIDYYQLTNTILDADIVVFPIDYSTFYKHKNAFLNLKRKAVKYKKPIWLYTAGDFGFTVQIPNSYTFRLGGFHSKLDKTTFIMPAFVNDPYEYILKMPFTEVKKEDKPSIGFVGHANSGFSKYIKSYFVHLKLGFNSVIKSSFFDRQPFYPSGIKRAQYLKKLELCKKLNTDFIFRKSYRAGAKDQKAKQETMEVFYKNIFDNLYTFCLRGAGNFSVRFYETLAVGRIPLLLDTDCRLPLNEHIDWGAHVVILNDSKRESLENQILHFHNSKSNEELIEIQQRNRKLWKSHLRRLTYFAKIHDLFVNEMIKTNA